MNSQYSKHSDNNTSKMYGTMNDDDDDSNNDDYKSLKGNANRILFNQLTSSS